MLFIIEAISVCENNSDSWLTVKKLTGAIWLRSFVYLCYSCTHLPSSDYCYVFNHNIPDGRGGKTSADLRGEESHGVRDLWSRISGLKQARLGNHSVEGRRSRVQPWFFEPITTDNVIIKGPAIKLILQFVKWFSPEELEVTVTLMQTQCCSISLVRR